MNKVTVIVNSYKEKKERFIKTLDSILNNKNVELQIILSTVKEDPCVDWVSNPKVDIFLNEEPGIFEQINNVVDRVKGDYVTYFSSNDFMFENKLKLESDLLRLSDKKVCYSSFYKKNINNTSSIIELFEYDFNIHLQKNFVSDCAMIRSDIFFKYTPFNLLFGNHAFYDFWLKIHKNEGNVFLYNPKPTWEYIVTNDSNHVKRQLNHEKKLKNERLRISMLNSYII